MATNPNEAEEQLPKSVDDASTDTNVADTSDVDRPVPILVQTKTHLVPGGKSPSDIVARIDRMVNRICQHVWQRDFDKFRERWWLHGREFALDNRPCWFLIDHHGPDPDPIPDPPVVWYT
ncbi:hypothetical protein N658DRAFT_461468 [Parathielavia hyrcaniae]|uniref:Uncharacterized protein n=1 Tax=Parathielavia hyrcaniae TaxID=113614 RepID=A0AAN6T7C6_9PEZI|nr:hypothetical protein N658DRAFT_461468 [Parathielavia hyrcaniae]